LVILEDGAAPDTMRWIRAEEFAAWIFLIDTQARNDAALALNAVAASAAPLQTHQITFS